MIQEFTVTWQKVRLNRLPLRSKNVQTQQNIFQDFQGLSTTTFISKYFEYFQGLEVPRSMERQSQV